MKLLLVRHPPVAKHWQSRCYGQSDPGLSREGRAMLGPLVDELAALRPDVIVHSDMIRTLAVAVPLAARLGLVAQADPLWRERDFGAWEGQSWQRIYRETGNAMDGMIDAPARFRPGGDGETTNQLMVRVIAALSRLPRGAIVAVVTHGGPIAAVRLVVDRAPVYELPTLIPKTGSITTLRIATSTIAGKGERSDCMTSRRRAKSQRDN